MIKVYRNPIYKVALASAAAFMLSACALFSIPGPYDETGRYPQKQSESDRIKQQSEAQANADRANTLCNLTVDNGSEKRRKIIRKNCKND